MFITLRVLITLHSNHYTMKRSVLVKISGSDIEKKQLKPVRYLSPNTELNFEQHTTAARGILLEKRRYQMDVGISRYFKL